MKFGIFYEHQLPRPWTEDSERRLVQEALDQVELADRLGIEYCWEVEHHFLEEYSHSSAPDNARISTVLLRADRVATGGFAWLHLHELPASAIGMGLRVLQVRDGAQFAAALGQGIVGVDRLMRLVERADAQMHDAGTKRGAIVAR